jgi:DNA-binding MarR family transcriptional regulator
MLDKTTCTRGIQKLVNAGFIQKKHDPHDKRAYLLYLTDKAQNLEKDIRQILNHWRKIVLTDFTIQEKKQLIDYLNKAVTNAQNFLNQHTDREQ